MTVPNNGISHNAGHLLSIWKRLKRDKRMKDWQVALVRLTSCLSLPLASEELPARTGDRVEERRRHFLLLLPEVESRGRVGE